MLTGALIVRPGEALRLGLAYEHEHDDPGAGKTIMAGLLLKELKIRGLVQRTLIVTPANLSFQWQRALPLELLDKDVYGAVPSAR